MGPSASTSEGGREAQVSVRHPTWADRDEFLARVADSRELHEPWITPPSTAGQFDAYIARLGQSAFEGYLACRAGDGAIVGYLNLSQIVRGPLQSAYLGYAGFMPFAGRGYMTEALRVVLHECFTAVGLHRVEANIQPDNRASIALVKRCGFQLEGFSPDYLNIAGEWRDHERWAIRREIWR
jgi:ribosomal-protein-alanine N-acetyltransferase